MDPVSAWRLFAVEPGGMLAAPTSRIDPDDPTFAERFDGPVCHARCATGHTPPDPGCRCGIHYFPRWASRYGPALCLVEMSGPRAYAEVEPLGQTLPEQLWLPLEWRLILTFGQVGRRAAAVRLLALWLPDFTHCQWCALSGPYGVPRINNATAATLGARYRVPVRRLAPEPAGSPAWNQRWVLPGRRRLRGQTITGHRPDPSGPHDHQKGPR